MSNQNNQNQNNSEIIEQNGSILGGVSTVNNNGIERGAPQQPQNPEQYTQQPEQFQQVQNPEQFQQPQQPQNPQNPPSNVINVTKAAQNTLDIRPPAIIAASALNKMRRIGNIEVNLPVLNESVICLGIKSLTDTEIRTLSASIHVYKEEILKAIYEAVEFKPDSVIKTFNDFLKLSYADITMLLFGVLKTSFNTGLHNNYTCQSCKSDFKTNIPMTQVNIIQTKENFKAKISAFEDTFVDRIDDQIKLVFKFDTIESKMTLLNKMSNEETRNKILEFGTLFTPMEVRLTKLKTILVTVDGADFTFNDENEIKTFINQLDLGTREILNERINKTCALVDEYIPKFSVDIKCPHCEHKMVWEDFDPMVEFFHKVSTLL